MVKVGRWVIFVFVITVVFTLTHIPQVNMPSDLGVGNFDKILHAGAYGVLAFVGIWAVGFGRGWRGYVGLAMMLAGLGVVDELTQPWVGRTCGVDDWAANVVGIVVVLGVVRVAGGWGRGKEK
ncbi:putative integral membrane protein [Anaerohalosphaera lusitana]|uniref:Putative integral membrane protein n=1 Tax=Anaerohalosphaera lusitana TaxID=1936003 RepID=A0A1U9NRB1_9BACT|nr:VanZ family protein [Anaerohalosphaera lusitana]AQT70317.1 putative integral membrane protein [Anaerohalosphaera lusitana]